MTLSDNQLTLLRLDLQRLADIKYDDVLAELLDHYATLTERYVADGYSFDDASKWAWNDMGQGEGIQRIQDDYITGIKKQVQSRHLTIVKSYFRWPAFLTTALVGLLTYLVVPTLPTEVIYAILILLTLTPTLLISWQYRKLRNEQTSQRFLVLEHAKEYGGQYITPIIFGQPFLTDFLDGKPGHAFSPMHGTVVIIICLLFLLYSVSFVQLLRERFSFRAEIA